METKQVDSRTAEEKEFETAAWERRRELAEKMETLLKQAGIPAKEIKVFGTTVMITCVARTTALDWFILLNNFCSNVKAARGLDMRSGAKPGDVPRKKYIQVYRIRGSIGKSTNAE